MRKLEGDRPRSPFSADEDIRPPVLKSHQKKIDGPLNERAVGRFVARGVSRILFLRKSDKASDFSKARQLVEGATIHLGCGLLHTSSSLPADDDPLDIEGDQRSRINRAVDLSTYLALLPAGVALPRVSPRVRWSLTPPFHPYQSIARLAVCFLLPCPSSTRRQVDASSLTTAVSHRTSILSNQ